MYAAKGADSDAAPPSLKGAPGGGGGFESTALDARPRPGIGAWKDSEDYPHPAAAWGSDAELYASLRSSGPSHGGAADPTADADRSHWRPALKISGVPDGTPVGTDELGFADRSVPGQKDRKVQIRKLPGALAPAGGIAVNKKYALKSLAGGAFELARLAALATFATASFTAGGSQPNAVQAGDTLDVPAGTYTVLFAWNRDQSHPNISRASVRLEWRAGSSGPWTGVTGLTSFSRTGFYFSSGQTGYRYRTGWTLDQDSQVRMLAFVGDNWAHFEKCALVMVEEA